MSVLSFQKKAYADLDYDETKLGKKLHLQGNCAQIDDWAREMEKDLGSIDPKTFSKSSQLSQMMCYISDGP